MAGRRDKDEHQADEPLTDDEIAAQQGEALPDREVMSLVTLTPEHPPPLGDWEPPPNMPLNNAIEPPPPTE